MIAWFRQLKIQGKLFGIFGFIVVIGALTIGIGILNVLRMRAEADNLLKQEKGLDDAYQAETFLQNMDLAEKSYVLDGDPRHLDNYKTEGAQLDVFLRNAFLEADAAQEKAALYEIKRAKQAYEQSFAEVVAAYDKGNVDEAIRLLEVSDEAINRIAQQLKNIIKEGQTFLDEEAQRAKNNALMSNIMGAIALVFFSASAIAAAVIIVNQVNRPVFLLTDAATTVEGGHFEPKPLEDLVIRTDEMGQLARAFVEMAEAVHKREEDLEQQADQLRLKIEQQTRKTEEGVYEQGFIH